jgi:hypothetical protein
MKKGLIEVMISIIGGIITSVLLQAFKQDNLIPSGYFWLFTIVGFIGSFVLILSYLKAGLSFMVGWIIGALILKSILSTFDFIVYVITPIAALVIRGIIAIKKSQSSY